MATSAIPWPSGPVSVRKIPTNLTLEMIEALSEGNNLDELVVENSSGRFLVYGDELERSVMASEIPLLPNVFNGFKIGEQIRVGKFEGTVLAVHNEINEELFLGSLLGVAIGVGISFPVVGAIEADGTVIALESYLVVGLTLGILSPAVLGNIAEFFTAEKSDQLDAATTKLCSEYYMPRLAESCD